MSTTDLYKLFQEFGPWITKFIIDGKEYGGKYNAMSDNRLKWFLQYFPDVQTILELGSLEGGHTFGVAKHPTVIKVIGIEGRKANIEKARFVQQTLGISNVEFIESNLEKTDLLKFGHFDAVFCVGLLYHLPNPWELIEQISHISENLFIWTHYAPHDRSDEIAHGYKGIIFQEGGLDEPLSGMSIKSFWPALDSLISMLKEYGFKTIHILENDPHHPNGPCVTLAAEQE